MSKLVTTTFTDSVAVVEMHRPPNNFFDEELLTDVATALFAVDEDRSARSVLLCSEGKHFCAGADLRGVGPDGVRRVYRQAFAVFSARKPVVAAIQGAAVGGGLGLAMAADFRVAKPDSRLTANFARLGFHPGFGLSVTLPAAVGQQNALDLLYTGRSLSGTQAHEIGLCDQLATSDLRGEALALAASIAESAPLSLLAIRATMRRKLVADVSAALDLEHAAQVALLDTDDFREGVDASVNRRTPEFTGQ